MLKVKSNMSVCVCVQDKRRIREDISHKRRDIEEEKLKLQYIKKKSLREQWLMDGLQSEEEREAMKIQAQDDLLTHSALIFVCVLRMEKEMEELEEQELDLSAKEENILKRLKEVERTTEDIIKVTPVHSWVKCTTTERGQMYPYATHGRSNVFCVAATFAMEISVELDKRTGKTQVISTASITPDMIQEKGLKVYEDTRKSVYALSPGGGSGEVSAMTHTDVDELLRQATDWSGDIQYHQPVYAAPFTGSSRPSTPGTFKTTNTASPSLGHDKSTRTPNPASSRTGSRLEVYSELEEEGNNHLISSSNMQANIEKSPSPQNYHLDTNESNLDRISPSYPESLASSLLEELDPGAVTMVFMGYENVDGDEEEPIEAEVVVIGNSDEEDMNEEDDLSIYHPNGYTSKVFQPVVGVAKVMDGRGFDEEMHWRESLPHKPTFRAGKNTPCQKEGRLQGSDKESWPLQFPVVGDITQDCPDYSQVFLITNTWLQGAEF
uniref:Palmdelphin n=1 Tax=Periophthalmus magnuspinnatus TaxID=409849 RepID=A0A3B4AQT8_9GOBI